jgi:hypothetical protein
VRPAGPGSGPQASESTEPGAVPGDPARLRTPPRCRRPRLTRRATTCRRFQLGVTVPVQPTDAPRRRVTTTSARIGSHANTGHTRAGLEWNVSPHYRGADRLSTAARGSDPRRPPALHGAAMKCDGFIQSVGHRTRPPARPQSCSPTPPCGSRAGRLTGGEADLPAQRPTEQKNHPDVTRPAESFGFANFTPVGRRTSRHPRDSRQDGAAVTPSELAAVLCQMDREYATRTEMAS